MPRIARVVIADVAHHVTQRGNGRQFLLVTDAERLVNPTLHAQRAPAGASGVRAGAGRTHPAPPGAPAARPSTQNPGRGHPPACRSLGHGQEP